MRYILEDYAPIDMWSNDGIDMPWFPFHILIHFEALLSRLTFSRNSKDLCLLNQNKIILFSVYLKANRTVIDSNHRSINNPILQPIEYLKLFIQWRHLYTFSRFAHFLLWSVLHSTFMHLFVSFFVVPLLTT